MLNLILHFSFYDIDTHFPLGSKETITCYSGLTVTDDNTDEVLFHHQQEEQCKIHHYCQTVTLTARISYSQDTCKY